MNTNHDYEVESKRMKISKVLKPYTCQADLNAFFNVLVFIWSSHSWLDVV